MLMQWRHARAYLVLGALFAMALGDGAGAADVCGDRGIADGNGDPPATGRLTTQSDHMRAFDDEVRALAGLLELPGMVVVVAQDGKIIHQVEYGHANVEAKERATIDHLFWIASVTKTFTATLIMQMVDEGLVRIDDPMIDYWFPAFYPVRITPDYRLRHVLGHTAQGTPGRTFVYNGGRYGFTYGVFEKVGGLPLKERLIRRVLGPLAMKSTMPGIGDERYKHLRGRLVTPYRYDPVKRRHVKAPDVLQAGDLFASTGMASSAVDLVRYAHALDTHEVLSANAHAEMTRPAVSTDGRPLPYGVGWFVQEHDGEKLVWHYGYGDADSALLVRVPRRRLTLVALANSDQLSASTLLGHGDVLISPVAVSFVKHFVSPENAPLASPDFDAATVSVVQRLEELRQGGASAIYDDEVFAQALARDYLGRRDSREDSKSSDLLRWLRRNSPERLRHADTVTLTLLSRQSDPELLAAAGPLLETLLAREPENPGVLSVAIPYHERSGHERQAVDGRRRLADLKGYEDDARKQEAALWLGEHLGRDDPDLARAYLWKAFTWWSNSGGGGDLGGRVTRAIDDLRRTRRGAIERGSSDTLRPGEAPR
jgi:CubicO group peptidase (beta-lactamase class C family)